MQTVILQVYYLQHGCLHAPNSIYVFYAHTTTHTHTCYAIFIMMCHYMVEASMYTYMQFMTSLEDNLSMRLQ